MHTNVLVALSLCLLVSRHTTNPQANQIASAGSAGNSSRPCHATNPDVSAKLTTQPNASNGGATSGQHRQRRKCRPSSFVFRRSTKYLSQPTSAPSSTSAKAQSTQLGGATFIQPKRAQNDPCSCASAATHAAGLVASNDCVINSA